MLWKQTKQNLHFYSNEKTAVASDNINTPIESKFRTAFESEREIEWVKPTKKNA